MEDKTYNHPSYGTISFNRTQGSARPLFGSSIEHRSVIVLTIKHAELRHKSSRDSIYGNKIIVKAEMSPTQFADAIINLNSAEIPITLNCIPSENQYNIPEPPYQNKVTEFNKEFGDYMGDLASKFDEVIDLAKKTKAQARLVKALELLKQGYKSNVPFVANSFSEQMENTVKEAKGEVEAFITAKVAQYGIDAIKQQAPQLPEGRAES